MTGGGPTAARRLTELDKEHRAEAYQDSCEADTTGHIPVVQARAGKGVFGTSCG